MEWVETTGRTIEEAKDAALDQLGVDETDAEFVIVAEPRPGLFGRMRGEARVRARVAPTSPRPKRGRPRREDQRRSQGRLRTGTGSGSSTTSESGAAAAVAVADHSDVVDGEVRAPSGSPNGPREGTVGAGEPASTSTRRSRSRGGRGRGGGVRHAAEHSAQVETEPAGESGSTGERPDARKVAGGTRGRPRAAEGAKEEAVGEVLSLEEQGEAASAFISGLVQELGLVAEVSMKVLDEDTVEVSVDGSSLGILIGPGGATLAALQELARTVVQKHTGGRSDRILIDVAGYRARRAEALQRFTRQIADEVLASGTEQALEPMSAADRKVVHDTVNEMTGVATRSEGEDPRRHIVIFPEAVSPDEETSVG